MQWRRGKSRVGEEVKYLTFTCRPPRGVVSEENCTMAPLQPTEGEATNQLAPRALSSHRLAAANKTGWQRRRAVIRLRHGETHGGGRARTILQASRGRDRHDYEIKLQGWQRKVAR